MKPFECTTEDEIRSILDIVPLIDRLNLQAWIAWTEGDGYHNAGFEINFIVDLIKRETW